ncbi:MAG: FAD-binding oxidoreductase [Pseudomonadota bacterium]
MDILSALQEIVGPQGLMTDPKACAPYLQESRGEQIGQALAVLQPVNASQVSRIVTLCAKAGIGIVPQGGNTGRVLGACPQAGQVLLSMTRLARMRSLDEDARVVCAEAGMTLAQVNRAAQAFGLMWPVDLLPKERAQVGGILASNAGGLSVVRYGNARASMLGVEAVLANGEIYDGLRQVRKDNCGYDLANLLVGSEGTLGIITAASLALTPIPKRRALCLLGITDIAHGIEFYRRFCARFSSELMICELMPHPGIENACACDETCSLPLDSLHDWYLLIGLAWYENDDRIEKAARTLVAKEVHTWEGDENIWRLREGIVTSQAKLGKSARYDISVPLSCLADFIKAANQAVQAIAPSAQPIIFGHLGDGNIHYDVLEKNPSAYSAFQACRGQLDEAIFSLVLARGGSICAEHGVGRRKRALLARGVSPTAYQAMVTIKKSLDPAGLLNPGVMFDHADLQ